MKTTIESKKKEGKIEREIRAIGKLINSERKAKKLSLAALSTLIQGDPYLSKPISEIERGKRPLVSFITICRICKALGIDVI